MKLSYIQLGNEEKRPVCFSLSAIEDLEDEFGSLEDMRNRLTSGSVKAINKVLEIMIRAGEIYCKHSGIECPPPLQCRPSDLIDSRDKEILSEIMKAIKGDSERTVEVKSKN